MIECSAAGSALGTPVNVQTSMQNGEFIFILQPTSLLVDI